MRLRGARAELVRQMAAVCGAPLPEAERDAQGEYVEITGAYLARWADELAAESVEAEPQKE